MKITRIWKKSFQKWKNHGFYLSLGSHSWPFAVPQTKGCYSLATLRLKAPYPSTYCQGQSWISDKQRGYLFTWKVGRNQYGLLLQRHHKLWAVEAFLPLCRIYSSRLCEIVFIFITTIQACWRSPLWHTHNLHTTKGSQYPQGFLLVKNLLSVIFLLISWALLWLLVHWRNKNNLIFLHTS